MPEFTEGELNLLAEMLCGRYDALQDIAANAQTMPNYRELLRDIADLEVLNAKLRSYRG